MEFINYTLNWCKGEIFEGKMSLLFGIVLLFISLAFWKWAGTPYAKTLFWPMAVPALLAIGAGIYLMTSNPKRMVEFPRQYGQNPEKFMLAEKQRTEAFIQWYPRTQVIFAVVMVLGMLCMILSRTPLIRSIGIGLMIMALYGFVLDHFSEERARIYHAQIMSALKG